MEENDQKYMQRALDEAREAERAGLPLVKIPLPYPCPNEAYERAMAAAAWSCVE